MLNVKLACYIINKQRGVHSNMPKPEQDEKIIESALLAFHKMDRAFQTEKAIRAILSHLGMTMVEGYKRLKMEIENGQKADFKQIPQNLILDLIRAMHNFHINIIGDERSDADLRTLEDHMDLFVLIVLRDPEEAYRLLCREDVIKLHSCCGKEIQRKLGDCDSFADAVCGNVEEGICSYSDDDDY